MVKAAATTRLRSGLPCDRRVRRARRAGLRAACRSAVCAGGGRGPSTSDARRSAASPGITESAHLAVGYWWISLDDESDEDDGQRRLAYDVVSSGPFAGFVFRF